MTAAPPAPGRSAPSVAAERVRKVGLTLAAPVASFVVALVVVVAIVLAAGLSVGDVLDSVGETMSRGRNVVDLINSTTAYYISALAVAIGFRMNLFNIGVDGQYRVAALAAAYVGGTWTSLPGPILLLVVLLTAVVVGAVWSGIAGLLKVTRGVSEVISTIMLNAIAVSLIAYLLADGGWGPLRNAGRPATVPIPEGAWFPDLDRIFLPVLDGLGFTPPPSSKHVYGFLIVAIVLGVLYAVVLKRTRFGFDLRASGQNPSAAAASGVNSKRMVLYAMLVSGGVAGLVGMSELLGGSTHNFSEQFPVGLGFTGIAVALLGRNSPVGMFVASVIWAFLDVSTRGFQLIGISNKLSAIMQAVVLLAVVIAYAVVYRVTKAAEARAVAARLTQGQSLTATGPAPAADTDSAAPSAAPARPEPGTDPPPGDPPARGRRTDGEGDRS